LGLKVHKGCRVQTVLQVLSGPKVHRAIKATPALSDRSALKVCKDSKGKKATRVTSVLKVLLVRTVRLARPDRRDRKVPKASRALHVGGPACRST
jgi:hypothetical protein